MTDPTPPTPTTPPEPPTPAPQPPTPPPSATSADEVKRFAVFDKTYQKFVGAVVDKRPPKADAKKLVGHDNFEIREV